MAGPPPVPIRAQPHGEAAGEEYQPPAAPWRAIVPRTPLGRPRVLTRLSAPAPTRIKPGGADNLPRRVTRCHGGHRRRDRVQPRRQDHPHGRERRPVATSATPAPAPPDSRWRPRGMSADRDRVRNIRHPRRRDGRKCPEPSVSARHYLPNPALTSTTLTGRRPSPPVRPRASERDRRLPRLPPGWIRGKRQPAERPTNDDRLRP